MVGLIYHMHQSITPEIWRPLVQNNDDFRIHIPKHLENLQKIPMQHLISTLKDTDLNNILNRWTWQDYMLLSLGIILALIILYGILNKFKIPGKLFEKCKKAYMSKSTKNDELSREEISDQRTSKLFNTKTPGFYPQLDSMDVSDPPLVIPNAAGTPCIVPSKSCTTSDIHKAIRA